MLQGPRRQLRPEAKHQLGHDLPAFLSANVFSGLGEVRSDVCLGRREFRQVRRARGIGRRTEDEEAGIGRPIRGLRGEQGPVIGVARAHLEIADVAHQGGGHVDVPLIQTQSQCRVTVACGHVAGNPRRSEPSGDTQSIEFRQTIRVLPAHLD